MIDRTKEVIKMRICFDMDGTIANFYGVEGWLDSLMKEDSKPYAIAKPLVNMNSLARVLNRLQREGHEIGIISWLSKNGTEGFNKEVAEVKKAWLEKHLKSVKFNFVTIVKYGTDKNIVNTNKEDILFDDEEGNRKNWKGIAHNVENIIETLKRL